MITIYQSQSLGHIVRGGSLLNIRWHLGSRHLGWHLGSWWHLGSRHLGWHFGSRRHLGWHFGSRWHLGWHFGSWWHFGRHHAVILVGSSQLPCVDALLSKRSVQISKFVLVDHRFASEDPGVLNVDETEEVLLARMDQSKPIVVRPDNPIITRRGRFRELNQQLGSLVWIGNVSRTLDPKHPHFTGLSRVHHPDRPIVSPGVIGRNALQPRRPEVELRDIVPPSQVSVDVEVLDEAHIGAGAEADDLGRRDPRAGKYEQGYESSHDDCFQVLICKNFKLKAAGADRSMLISC